MAGYTEHLNLLKKDPVTDGADTFNVDTMLNENWDKVDTAIGDLEKGVEAPTESKSAPEDADSIALMDSADKGEKKKLTWAAIKMALGGALTPASHTHVASEINSGTLASARLPTVPVSKGGTGATTAATARSNLGACGLVAPVTVTAAAAGWTGSGPWTQTVSVAGVTAADEHIGVFPVDVADADARKLYETAYGCLAAEAETVAGGVKLTCRESKPEISFQVKIKGVR